MADAAADDDSLARRAQQQKMDAATRLVEVTADGLTAVRRDLGKRLKNPAAPVRIADLDRFFTSLNAYIVAVTQAHRQQMATISLGTYEGMASLDADLRKLAQYVSERMPD